MLNKEHLKVRRKKDLLFPAFAVPDNSAAYNLAEAFIALYRRGAEEKLCRGEIRGMTEVLIRGAEDPAMADAFRKLAEDCSEFEKSGDADYPAIRAELFARSGRLIGRTADPAEYMRLASDTPAFQLLHGGDIYGDLPENERLVKFKELTAPWLIHRYNLAQVQGLIMTANRLKIFLEHPETGELRRLFKYLKFFRLLADIKRHGDDFTLEVSGPFEIFANTRKYALQLASFLPALVLLPSWRLEAEVRWKNRTSRLILDESSGLKSHYRSFSSYVPEEITMFHRLFRQKVQDWQIAGEAPIWDDGTGGVIFPDLSFRYNGAEAVHLELFHRWHRTELERRLAFLARRPELRLVIGIDRSLTGNAAFKELTLRFPAIAGRMFLFRDFPGVDRVHSMLKKWE